MRLLIGLLVLVYLLGPWTAKSEASAITFGLAAGLDLEGSAIVSTDEPGTAAAAFIAWPLGDMARARLALHWTHLTERTPTARAPAAPRKADGSLARDIDIVRLVLTEQWYHQARGPARSYVAFGFGICSMLDSSQRDSQGLVLCPSVGLDLKTRAISIGLESGCELVLTQERRIPMIPVRLLVSF